MELKDYTKEQIERELVLRYAFKTAEKILGGFDRADYDNYVREHDWLEDGDAEGSVQCYVAHKAQEKIYDNGGVEPYPSNGELDNLANKVVENAWEDNRTLDDLVGYILSAYNATYKA